MRHTNLREPQPGRIPKKQRTLPLLPLLVGLVVVLVVVNVAVLLTRSTDAPVVSRPRAASPVPSAGSSATTTQNSAIKQKVDFGVFVGTDAKAAADFEKWMGRPIQDVVDFSNRDSWSDISNPDYVLANWRNTKYRLIYAIPMLPDSLKATKQTAMANGATGAYDQYFKQLATRLVAGGHEDAVLRIGWEFNIDTWAWGGTKDPKVFVGFFRHVVNAMRSVPGAKFNINWNPNNGYNPYDAVKYWPGNAYVDSVGIDAYDVDKNRYPYPKNCNRACREERQQTAWDEAIYGGPRGLSFWTFFAQQHKKEFSLPEFAMWDRYDGTGGGDNPSFLNQMEYFIHQPANNVAFAAYFNRNSEDGLHEIPKNFPTGTKRFLKLFGK